MSPLLLLTIGLTAALLSLIFLQLARPVPEMLIAKRDLAQGELLEIANFEAAAIDLGKAQDSYIPFEEFPQGSSLAKSISKGEVLARSQITEVGPKGMTVIRFMPELPIPRSLEVGDRVAIWVVRGEQFEDLDPAVQISLGRLMKVEASEGLFADEQPYVEITVPELTLPEVLSSLAADDRVFLIEPAT